MPSILKALALLNDAFLPPFIFHLLNKIPN